MSAEKLTEDFLSSYSRHSTDSINIDAVRCAFEEMEGRGLFGRDPSWPAKEKAHLKIEPVCQWCGTTEHLQVHHLVPFHCDPSSELKKENLISLCMSVNECHFKHGHFDPVTGKCNWKLFNPNIKAECLARQSLKKEPLCNSSESPSS